MRQRIWIIIPLLTLLGCLNSGDGSSGNLPQIPHPTPQPPTSPGSLDVNFGSGGMVVSDFGAIGKMGSQAHAVVVQSDGKIVAVGYVYSPTFGRDFALVRYNPDGIIDTTFGDDGFVATDFGYSYDQAMGAVIQSDGKIIAAGFTNLGPAGANFALARYNLDGTLDTTFGSEGIVITDFGETEDIAMAVAIQWDGKIVAAGYTIPYNSNLALARYNQDGSLDTSFGVGGKVSAAFEGYNYNVSGIAVAIQSNGKIVMAGYTNSQLNDFSSDFALARFDSDGSLDVTFGNNGRVITAFSAMQDDEAWAVAIQSDGKIVAVGFTGPMCSYGSTNCDIALARYNPDGSLDTSFGNQGKVTTDIGPSDFTSSYDWANAVAIQEDGKIIVAGATEYYNPNYQEFAVLRYKTDGSLDTSFGADGKVHTDFDMGGDAAASVSIQPDGKIIVAGGTLPSGPGYLNFALARYWP